MRLGRREYLRLLGGLPAANLLAGCVSIDPVTPRCPEDPDLLNPDAPLAIDIHAHIFNATDLQVKDFVRRVAVRQGGGLGALAELLGGFLQSFAWRRAPDAEDELRELARIKTEIEQCGEEGVYALVNPLRNQKYEEGRSELMDAAQLSMQQTGVTEDDLNEPTESLSGSKRGLREINSLPLSYDELFKPASGEISLERKTPRSVLRFVMEMFQYRYVSLYNYLDMYNRDSEIKIDLLTPSAVDFDWWLSSGVPTRSSLPAQMLVMKEISILSGGRVHPLVPFDPFRQVVHERGASAGFSPIQLVQRSVEELGAVGVKLYPPMGFAPYGNADAVAQNPGLWTSRSWLPEIVSDPAFGERLDVALKTLYDYCADNGVPVLGHSNESNGPAEDFEQLTAPKYWRNALEAFPRTSYCFGHFGGVGSESTSGSSNVEGFLKLIADRQAQAGATVVADASYFVNVLDRPTALHRALQLIYESAEGELGPALDALLYGADWKMLAAEADSENYLADFVRAIDRLEAQYGTEAGIRKKFFGGNAASFLGLQRGGKNRQRLEAFYDRNGVTSVPVWMEKVDAA